MIEYWRDHELEKDAVLQTFKSESELVFIRHESLHKEFTLAGEPTQAAIYGAIDGSFTVHSTAAKTQNNEA